VALAANANAPDNPQTDFEYVCEQVENIYGEGCGSLLPPIIVYSRVIELDMWRVLNGVYIPGEPYIFIHPTAPEATVVHEMTHYVLDSLGLEQDRCRHEEIARFVAGQTDPTWRARYGCTNENE
jgi:hypothetical protein